MIQRDLVEELAQLGHEYITVPRRQRFVDWAMRRITHAENWPQRWVRVPLASFDAQLHGQIDAVVGAGRHLRLSTLDEMSSFELSTPGVPSTYYFEGQALKVWPVSTDVQVICWTRGIWTLGGASAASEEDTPVLPVDFDDLFILEARMHCLEDTDEDGLRDALAVRAAAELARLKDLHMNQNADEPHSIEIRTGSYT